MSTHEEKRERKVEKLGRELLGSFLLTSQAFNCPRHEYIKKEQISQISIGKIYDIEEEVKKSSVIGEDYVFSGNFLHFMLVIRQMWKLLA
ncbi:CLUMA_CG000728, isoform A [Clunio marinus]|uniref:CLUMA_CG000728, isoform A n=1 Tax=Clunio marinus TaxID=568069 RepID=A0A1J1HGA6_9DIPT|nr:CLUMA_CG000728, isoform A [Clunio marinus]